MTKRRKSKKKSFSGTPEQHRVEAARAAQQARQSASDVRYHLSKNDCHLAVESLVYLAQDVERFRTESRHVSKREDSASGVLRKVETRFIKQCLKRPSRGD